MPGLTGCNLQGQNIRTLATTAGKAYMQAASGSAQKEVLPFLLDAMEVKRNWQTKVGALQLLEAWAKVAPVEVALSLPEIIPIVGGCLADAKPQVKNAAIKAMTVASAAMGNKDIESLVPAVIEAMAKPEKVADTIHKLGATTFVAAVTGTAYPLPSWSPQQAFCPWSPQQAFCPAILKPSKIKHMRGPT